MSLFMNDVMRGWCDARCDSDPTLDLWLFAADFDCDGEDREVLGELVGRIAGGLLCRGLARHLDGETLFRFSGLRCFDGLTAACFSLGFLAGLGVARFSVGFFHNPAAGFIGFSAGLGAGRFSVDN